MGQEREITSRRIAIRRKLRDGQLEREIGKVDMAGNNLERSNGEESGWDIDINRDEKGVCVHVLPNSRRLTSSRDGGGYWREGQDASQRATRHAMEGESKVE